MASSGAKKLSGAARRRQLLEVALEIVAERGADALKLGYLAERAGVSKPIAYEHFGTRAGLLISLYRDIDARQVKAVKKALEHLTSNLQQSAQLIAGACMRCYATLGPEWYAISAALQGDGEMNGVHQELLDGYVTLFCDALATFTTLDQETLHLRCVGIVGAAEAMAREMLEGRVNEAAATASLATMIIGAVSQENR